MDEDRKLQHGEEVTVNTVFEVTEEWEPEEMINHDGENVVELFYDGVYIRVPKSDIHELIDQENEE